LLNSNNPLSQLKFLQLNPNQDQQGNLVHKLQDARPLDRKRGLDLQLQLYNYLKIPELFNPLSRLSFQISLPLKDLVDQTKRGSFQPQELDKIKEVKRRSVL
jgi:hypothetical protein